ncbi:outer membrane assembly protein AsmA [Pantoea sp. 1.19]|uniref:outer membrane assembly protein AsmA n=1 Tax=Pantoea sp. 1.19 TaxID=1925589 RepID=UPI000948DB3C|nr:outer membrane assembly protein AsmA [Pantoea sp. 1.19]
MRRVITTLAILLVVIVAGMTALVLLVNPNDFRSYMVRQVEQRSGYQLKLEGDLRWHVWPQLSILAGRMSLTAPGATQPLVSAENMRLDVHLLPLLSHQLAVRQVMLKGAVIRVTPESAARRPDSAPHAPDNDRDALPIDRGWSFDIGRLEVADSLLVWQPSGGEAITFRDIDLLMKQDNRQQAQIALSSRVSRDQRTLQFSLAAEMNVSGWPRQIDGTLHQFDYRLSGADLPKQGIAGQASLQARWRDDQHFALDKLAFSANDSAFTGRLSGSLASASTLQMDLHASNLNLDSLLGISEAAGSGSAGAASGNGVSGARPVIATAADSSSPPTLIRDFTSRLKLSADALHWRGLNLQQVVLDAENQRGIITLNTFRGRSGAGHFSLPGTLDLRSAPSQVALAPDVTDLALTPLLTAFNLPTSVSGNLTLNGQFSGRGMSVEDVKRHWTGRADVRLNAARLHGLNFQQMIQRAVASSSDKVQGEQSDVDYTELKQLQANAVLDSGSLALDQLRGDAALLTLTGEGSVSLARRQCDIQFAITVTGGWRGESQLTQLLSTTPIPLRLYGNWDALNYSLKVDDVLRGQLESEAKKRLNQWADKNQHKQSGKDLKQFLDHL